ncbi:DNA-3-methyladenine glycosylase [Candidatus Woesearchaeota archaeon]|nr:DNA-3-methyladenine glycosylase [Candidatus Woesearchaeota archaeon]
MKLLSENFFARDTVAVARDLLGKVVMVNGCSARVVETEAYKQDKASHAYKKTERSLLMYDTYGYVYVYLIYGMYWCLNFTTEKKGVGAVLIRAVEPLSGIEEMKKRRKEEIIATNLCSGPGKVCMALGIDKRLNGLKIGNEVKLFEDNYLVKEIRKSSRIGIKEAQHLPWRFFVEGNKFVSRG